MTSWILVYSFMVPGNMHFNQPVIMDHFTAQAQCNAALDYIDTQYKKANIVGSGHCWGPKNDNRSTGCNMGCEYSYSNG